MQGFKDLLGSERGAFCICALIGVLALALLGRIAGTDALDFVKWLTGALVLSKTITTTVEARAKAKDSPEVPTATTTRDNLNP